MSRKQLWNFPRAGFSVFIVAGTFTSSDIKFRSRVAFILKDFSCSHLVWTTGCRVVGRGTTSKSGVSGKLHVRSFGTHALMHA